MLRQSGFKVSVSDIRVPNNWWIINALHICSSILKMCSFNLLISAVQIDPFLGLSRLSGASPTRLDPFPSWAVQVSSTHFLIASYLVSSFPLPIPSKHFRCVSSRSFRFLVFSVHLHVCTVRCFSGAYPLGPLSAPISVLGEELPDPPR